MVVAAPKKAIHLALLELGEERARSVQNRVADSITRFAGSMWFAYLHIVWVLDLDRSGDRAIPVRVADHDRVTRGHLPVDVRDDQPEPPSSTALPILVQQARDRVQVAGGFGR